MSVQNCHCGECPPFGACCYDGENTNNVVYESLGTRGTSNEIAFQYSLTNSNTIKNLLGFTGQIDVAIDSLKVKCNSNALNQGPEQGVIITFLTPSHALTYTNWVTGVTGTDTESINNVIMRVKVTDSNADADVGDSYFYKFDTYALSGRELKLRKSQLMQNSNKWPEFAETGGNRWGDNPDISIYPEKLYDESGCTYTQQIPCIERPNSTCWIVDKECNVCPSKGGSTVDDCGCWIDNPSDGVDDLSVCNEGCGGAILDTCDSTDSTLFEPTFLNSSGSEQNGFVVGTQAPYKDAPYPTQCGTDLNCVTSDPCCNNPGFCQCTPFISWGDNDLYWSEAEAGSGCTAIGFETISGVYKKIIRMCSATDSDFGLGSSCGDCCFCEDTVNPCSKTEDPFSESLENTMPKKWLPVYSTLTIPKERVIFERTGFINKLTAKVLVESTPTDESNIPVTNLDYPADSPVRNLAGVWKPEKILGFGTTGGTPDQEAYSFMNNDWSQLNTTWQMRTYCLQDIEDELGLSNNGYNTLFQNFASNEAWYTTIMNTEDPVFLRIWTTSNRSVVADYTESVNQNDCCNGTTPPTFRLDMEYRNDSQTERIPANGGTCENSSGDCDCCCKWGNPWRTTNTCTNSSTGFGTDKLQPTFNSSGNKLTDEPAEGNFRYPLIPHEYAVELWYIGERDTICSDSTTPRSYPSNFKFMGVINEVVQCNDVRLRPDGCGENGINDTCQTFYHQSYVRGQRRRKIKTGYAMPNDGTAEPWNGPLQLTNCDNVTNGFDSPCDWHGLDDSTLTRKITLQPINSGSGGSDDGEGDGGDSENPLIPQLNAPSSADSLWKNGGTVQEQDWYHSDPKHNFDAIAMGRPQVIGRFTEIPFINVADKFLDNNKTIPGFYLTITAFHMDGIDRVEFYLDGGTIGNGAVSVNTREVHPLETSVAKISRDSEGNYDTGLREYTVKIPTDALSTGVHEVRAKIYPSLNSEGKIGVPRFIYGEPPTGDAGVLLEGQTLSGRVAGEYVSFGPIAGKNWPVSQAQWPQDVPDGPVIEDGSVNPNPMFGAEHRFNLANNGFSYQVAEGSLTRADYPADRYIFGATNQEKLLQNGYESYWFNYNPDKTRIWVGASLPSDAPTGSELVSTIWEAFVLLKDNYSTGGALNAAQYDAEIILVEGTKASPTQYWWPNSKRNPADGVHNLEGFTSGNGFSTTWCQNASAKKSIVIRGENPESKDKTKILMPPGSDRSEFKQNNFSLHVKDLTLMTSLMGHNPNNGRSLSGLGCFATDGESCRIVVENVLLNSKCANNITASDLVDSSGNIICGDTRKRDSSGNLTGGITYLKCPKLIATSSNLPCAADTSLCGSDCCGATSDDGVNCTDCTTATCSNCGQTCGCRQYGTTWWPFISKDSIDLQTDSNTDLLPYIDCGDNTCSSAASWSCKGMFGNDIVTTSPYMCLGTNPEDCLNMGKWNQDLMPIAQGDDWGLGAYGKYVESRNTPGPTVVASMLIKHMQASAASVDLISNKTHSCVMDVYVYGSDSMTQPSGIHNDFVQWTNNAPQWWKPVKKPDGTAIVDYTSIYSTTGDEYPRRIQNFNVVAENRIIHNIKLTSHFGRIIQWPAPSMSVRDALQDPASEFKKDDWGHPSNFGTSQLRNMSITNFHFEDTGGTVQQNLVTINHYYIDNWITTSSDPERSCDSDDPDTNTCGIDPLEPRSRTPLGRAEIGESPIVTFDYGLYYGKKLLTNLYINNFCVETINGSRLGWEPTGTTLGTSALGNEFNFSASFDYGPNSAGKMGSNFNIILPVSEDDQTPSDAAIPYYWTGSHTPVFKNIRQTRFTDNGLLLGGANQTGTDSHLSTANVKATNITGGPIVILSRSPKPGRTSFGGDIFNVYSKDSSTMRFKADRNAMTPEQLLIWKPDEITDRLDVVSPRTAKTFITSASTITKDDKNMVSSSFDFPAVAHCDLLDKGDDITKYGIPNVGAIDLNIANDVQYYHSLCSWKESQCRRVGPVEERRHSQRTLTEIMQEVDGVRSWVDNPNAGCFGKCLTRRDHYFVDYETDSVDVTWCPVIDECLCSDL